MLDCWTVDASLIASSPGGRGPGLSRVFHTLWGAQWLCKIVNELIPST